MFKRTDRQVSLWGVESRCSKNIQRRLGQSWSDAFHKKVYPVLLRLEGEFARLYADGTGRPNYSVARIVGIALLQEMFGLADQQALDALVFDLRWQHALGFAQEEEAYLSRRSYVEFRRRLAKQDPEMTLLRRVFDQVGAAAMEDLDVSPTEQRLDSTRIVSNIAHLGRTDLFATTLRVFLRELKRRWPDKWESLPNALREWYEAKESGNGWFSGGGADKQRQRLEQLGQWLWDVQGAVHNDPEVASCEPYQVLARLVREQLEWTEPKPTEPSPAASGPDLSSPADDGSRSASEPPPSAAPSSEPSSLSGPTLADELKWTPESRQN